MINYQKSNKPQLDLNKIEKIIIERQKKEKDENIGEKCQRIFQQENKKILDNYGIDFELCNKNLQIIENEIKQLKKTFAKQKKKEEIKEKEDELLTIKEKTFNFAINQENKVSKMHEINEDKIEYLKLIKKNENDLSKKFINHEIDYYKKNRKNSLDKNSTGKELKHDYLKKNQNTKKFKKENATDTPKQNNQVEAVVERAKRIMEKQEYLMEIKNKLIQKINSHSQSNL